MLGQKLESFRGDFGLVGVRNVHSGIVDYLPVFISQVDARNRIEIFIMSSLYNNIVCGVVIKRVILGFGTTEEIEAWGKLAVEEAIARFSTENWSVIKDEGRLYQSKHTGAELRQADRLDKEHI